MNIRQHMEEISDEILDGISHSILNQYYSTKETKRNILRKYLKPIIGAAVDKAREEVLAICINTEKVADFRSEGDKEFWQGYGNGASDCAEKIRALIGKPVGE